MNVEAAARVNCGCTVGGLKMSTRHEVLQSRVVLQQNAALDYFGTNDSHLVRKSSLRLLSMLHRIPFSGGSASGYMWTTFRARELAFLKALTA